MGILVRVFLAFVALWFFGLFAVVGWGIASSGRAARHPVDPTEWPWDEVLLYAAPVALIVAVGLVARRRIRHDDVSSAVADEPSAGFSAPSVLPWEGADEVPTDTPSAAETWLTTLVVAVRSEKRADIAAAIAARPPPYRLLVELVEADVAPAEALGLVTISRERADLTGMQAGDHVGRRLHALVERDRAAEGGFREGTSLRSRQGPGTSVLALALVTRGGEAPERLRARGDLLPAIERLLPAEPEHTLALAEAWVPTDPDRSFDEATLRAVFPELAQLEDD